MTDWYIIDDKAICYPCAMARLRKGETPIVLYPEGPMLRCSDCHTILERVGEAWIPLFLGDSGKVAEHLRLRRLRG